MGLGLTQSLASSIPLPPHPGCIQDPDLHSGRGRKGGRSPQQTRSTAHHLEEGHLRVKVVGLLVPQDQIVSCINDDLLQVDKGTQQPVGQERDCVDNDHGEPICPRQAHPLTVAQGVRPVGW